MGSDGGGVLEEVVTKNDPCKRREFNNKACKAVEAVATIIIKANDTQDDLLLIETEVWVYFMLGILIFGR